MKLEHLLTEDSLRSMLAKYFQVKTITPQLIKDLIGQMGTDNTSRYVKRSLTKKQKEAVEKKITKWLKSHSDDSDANELEVVLKNLKGVKSHD